MSSIGYTSGQIERKHELLDALNGAVLTLQADALALRATMGIGDAAVDAARAVARRFVIAVDAAFGGRTDDPIIDAVIRRIPHSGKPIDDWRDDLRSLQDALGRVSPVGRRELSVLTDLLRLVDREFTDDLYRLYGRR
jgi:hypothetical protein